ncbi:MAG: arsenite methyltransferase [Bacteroidota bacterium]
MRTNEELKEIVKQKYSQIASQNTVANKASCCGATPSSEEVYNIMTDEYDTLDGHVEDADLGLGCGLPTQFAHIKQGDTVLDLGSGAGNDAFVARHETGAEGKVLGVDFSPQMVAKARRNAEKLGYNNVEFREGDIDDMPVSDESVDVVVSNCVLNLLPDKSNIFNEIYRVLKPSGHFSISDVVIRGELPEYIVREAEMYAGCVSGAIEKNKYLKLVKDAGFYNISIQKDKPIHVPDDIMLKYFSKEKLDAFRSSGVGIYSITLFATKAKQLSDSKKEASTKVTTQETSTACCRPGCC